LLSSTTIAIGLASIKINPLSSDLKKAHLAIPETGFMSGATPLRQPGYPLMSCGQWTRGFASSSYLEFAIIGEIILLSRIIAH